MIAHQSAPGAARARINWLLPVVAMETFCKWLKRWVNEDIAVRCCCVIVCLCKECLIIHYELHSSIQSRKLLFRAVSILWPITQLSGHVFLNDVWCKPPELTCSLSASHTRSQAAHLFFRSSFHIFLWQWQLPAYGIDRLAKKKKTVVTMHR